VKLEEVRPGVVRLTLHVAELGSLVTAARLVEEGGGARLPSAAASQLADVLRSYDGEVARLHTRARDLKRAAAD
jgi:hypothetical protein